MDLDWSGSYQLNPFHTLPFTHAERMDTSTLKTMIDKNLGELRTRFFFFRRAHRIQRPRVHHIRGESMQIRKSVNTGQPNA